MKGRARQCTHVLPAASLLVLGLLVAQMSALADSPTTKADQTPPPITAGELDEAVDDVISRPQYAWRLPRENQVDEENTQGVLAKFAEDLGRYLTDAWSWLWKHLRRIIEWLRDRLDFDRPLPQGSTGWQAPVQALLFVLVAATLSFLAILGLRLWKGRKRNDVVTATPLTPSPELLHDEAPADALPSEEWMALAHNMFAQGDVRLGLRAMFLSCLAHLGERGIVSIAMHKSNRDYIREVERRAHDIAGMIPAFAANVSMIERVWYGRHPATDAMVSSFEANHRCLTTAYSPKEAHEQ